MGIYDFGYGLKTFGLGEDFKQHSIGDRKGIQSTNVAAIRTELPDLCSPLFTPFLVTELGGDKSNPRSAASLIHRISPCFLIKVDIIDVLRRDVRRGTALSSVVRSWFLLLVASRIGAQVPDG